MVYRAKTYYHLLLILLLIKDSEYNVLYLDGGVVNQLYDPIRNSKLFNKVIINKSLTTKSKFLRKIYTLSLAISSTFLRKLFKKNIILITSQHNIVGSMFFEYVRASSLTLLEDGQYSYKKTINNEINSLYCTSGIKGLLSNYFLTIKNPLISCYIFTDRKKLKNNLYSIYEHIKYDIHELDLDKKIINTKNKKAILDIFIKKRSIILQPGKKLILLTQPYDDPGFFCMFDKHLKFYFDKGYQIYLKQHPREKNCRMYDKVILEYRIIMIEKDLPFELLLLFNIKFDVGLTYDSTAINSKIIYKKILTAYD